MERLYEVGIFMICRGFFLLLVFVIGLAGCSEFEELEDTYLGYDFFPLELGRFQVYEVEEIEYLIAGFDTSSYFLKETIYDTILNSSNVQYLVKQEVRNTPEDSWELDSLYTISQSASILVNRKNNRSVIQMVFPVRSGKNWDANGLNSEGVQNRYYEEADSVLLDSLDLQDHIKVVLADIAPNVTGVDSRSEVYARGIGLLQKNYFTQTNCTASDCGQDLGQVIGGRSLKQTLLEIGNEN